MGRASILYDADNRPLAVQDGVAIPASTSGIALMGKDENAVARTPLVESILNAEVQSLSGAYGARFCPFNALTTAAPIFAAPLGYWNSALGVAPAFGIVFSTGSFTPLGAPLNFTCASYLVTSTSANDTVGGTGVNSIIIQYMGSDGQTYRVALDMNGTIGTTIALSVPSRRIDMAFQTRAGSLQAAAGNIKFYRDANLADQEWNGFTQFWLVGGTLGNGANTGPVGYIGNASKKYYISYLRLGTADVADSITWKLRLSLLLITNPTAQFQRLDLDMFTSSSGTTGQTFSISYDPPICMEIPANCVGQVVLEGSKVAGPNVAAYAAIGISETA